MRWILLWIPLVVQANEFQELTAKFSRSKSHVCYCTWSYLTDTQAQADAEFHDLHANDLRLRARDLQAAPPPAPLQTGAFTSAQRFSSERQLPLESYKYTIEHMELHAGSPFAYWLQHPDPKVRIRATVDYAVRYNCALVLNAVTGTSTTDCNGTKTNTSR